MGPSALGACISPPPCILMASRCHMMPTSSEDPSETLRLYQLAIDYLIIFASKLPPIVVSPSPEVFASHDSSPNMRHILREMTAATSLSSIVFSSKIVEQNFASFQSNTEGFVSARVGNYDNPTAASDYQLSYPNSADNGCGVVRSHIPLQAHASEEPRQSTFRP
jgi:hypothetical protein